MNKIAMYKEEIYKEAGFKLTKPNPNPLSEKEMEEFKALGARIDKKDKTMNGLDYDRFYALANRAPKSYFAPHFTKKASEHLDELVKEAGIVAPVSRATNKIKRAGQLLTGSYARGLKKSLKNMQNNTRPMSLKESIKSGEKMMLTHQELGKEVKKVRAARAGVAGTAGVGAIGLNKNTEQEQGI